MGATMTMERPAAKPVAKPETDAGGSGIKPPGPPRITADYPFDEEEGYASHILRR